MKSFTVRLGKSHPAAQIISTLQANGIAAALRDDGLADVTVSANTKGAFTFLSQQGIGYVRLTPDQFQDLAKLQAAPQEHQM